MMDQSIALRAQAKRLRRRTPHTHAAGTFCWLQLRTGDADRAAAFYAEVYGWQTREVRAPAAPDEPYRVFAVGDHVIGGMHCGAGEPTLAPFLAVDDVDAGVERAVDLGALSQRAPFDVPGVGRAARIEDPLGAPLTMWLNTSPHAGAAKIGWRTIGAVCWNELVCDRPESAMHFYGDLLGWRAQAQPGDDLPYFLFLQGERRAAGLRPQLGCQSRCTWLSYVLVDDLRRRARRAERMGGRVVMPPRRMTGIGRYTWIADSEGAISAMVQRD